MPSNRGVAYVEPGKVEVQSIAYPKLKMPASETNPFGGKDAPHGVILQVVTTNICGSDQHMVRGRTTAPKGLILGHEITGDTTEKRLCVDYPLVRVKGQSVLFSNLLV
jgi:glutathione-independent formaldehyde dehydrogenase